MGGGSVHQDTTTKVTGPVIKVGSILFAFWDTGINSNEKTPIFSTMCNRKIKRREVNWEFCPGG